MEQLTSVSEASDKDNLKIEKIKQYIYQNYASPLTLDDIAAAFYISPNYLCSVFKKETGCNLINSLMITGCSGPDSCCSLRK